MSVSDTQQAIFQQNGDELESYRSLSVTAVLSLIFGILSAGSLVYPAFWGVGVVAVLFGVFSLRAIARDPMLDGKWMARAGIVLALFLVSMSITRNVMARSLTYQEARVVATEFLELVIDGQDKVAHQVMVNPTLRLPPDASVDEFYAKDEEARQAKDEIFKSSPMSDLLGLGSEARIEHKRNLTQDVQIGQALFIRQTYVVTHPSHEPIEVAVSLSRDSKSNPGRVIWIVLDVSEPEADER